MRLSTTLALLEISLICLNCWINFLVLFLFKTKKHQNQNLFLPLHFLCYFSPSLLLISFSSRSPLTALKITLHNFFHSSSSIHVSDTIRKYLTAYKNMNMESEREWDEEKIEWLMVISQRCACVRLNSYSIVEFFNIHIIYHT